VLSSGSVTFFQPGYPPVQQAPANRAPVYTPFGRQCRQKAESQSPKEQDVWREADFDAIPVPSFCNLPKEEVQRIQRNFLGRPVMQHGSSSDEALQQLRSKGYSSWKEYLLQVGKCPVFSCSKLCSHYLYQPGSQFE